MIFDVVASCAVSDILQLFFGVFFFSLPGRNCHHEGSHRKARLNLIHAPVTASSYLLHTTTSRIVSSSVRKSATAVPTIIIIVIIVCSRFSYSKYLRRPWRCSPFSTGHPFWGHHLWNLGDLKGLTKQDSGTYCSTLTTWSPGRWEIHFLLCCIFFFQLKLATCIFLNYSQGQTVS